MLWGTGSVAASSCRSKYSCQKSFLPYLASISFQRHHRTLKYYMIDGLEFCITTLTFRVLENLWMFSVWPVFIRFGRVHIFQSSSKTGGPKLIWPLLTSGLLLSHSHYHASVWLKPFLTRSPVTCASFLDFILWATLKCWWIRNTFPIPSLYFLLICVLSYVEYDLEPRNLIVPVMIAYISQRALSVLERY